MTSIGNKHTAKITPKTGTGATMHVPEPVVEALTGDGGGTVVFCIDNESDRVILVPLETALLGP